MLESTPRRSLASNKRLSEADEVEKPAPPKSFYKSSSGVYLNPFERKKMGISKPKPVPFANRFFNPKIKGKISSNNRSAMRAKIETILKYDNNINVPTKRLTRTRPVYAPSTPKKGNIEKLVAETNKSSLVTNKPNIVSETVTVSTRTDSDCQNDHLKENIDTSPVRKSPTCSPGKSQTRKSPVRSPGKASRIEATAIESSNIDTSPGKTPKPVKRFFKYTSLKALEDLKKSVLHSSSIFEEKSKKQKKPSKKKIARSNIRTKAKSKQTIKTRKVIKPSSARRTRKQEVDTSNAISNDSAQLPTRGQSQSSNGHLTTCSSIPSVSDTVSAQKLPDPQPDVPDVKRLPTPRQVIVNSESSNEEFIDFTRINETVMPENLTRNWLTPEKTRTPEKIVPSPRRSSRFQKEKFQNGQFINDQEIIYADSDTSAQNSTAGKSQTISELSLNSKKPSSESISTITTARNCPTLRSADSRRLQEVSKNTKTFVIQSENSGSNEVNFTSIIEKVRQDFPNVNLRTPEKTQLPKNMVPSPRRSPRIQKEKSQNRPLNEDQRDADDDNKTKLFPIFTRSPITDRVVSKRSPSLVSPLSKKYKKLKSQDGWEQLIIDAGQKALGPQMCKTCGMLFSTYCSDDQDLHLRYHAIFLGNLSFQGWKKENVVGDYADGRVLLIRPGDSSFMLKKIEEVREVVDRDLGFSEQNLPKTKGNAYFLFISRELKKVVGCLIADSITEAYHLLPSHVPNNEASYCSKDPVSVVCGISRIWTAPKWRRNKVASRLVDCLRCHFLYGQVLSLSEIAFSAPTVSGRSFAEKYTGRKSFLVY